MIDIYEIDEFGQWTGAVEAIGEADGCAPDWVRAPTPPEVPEGGAVVWAIGRWHVRQERISPQGELESPPAETTT